MKAEVKTKWNFEQSFIKSNKIGNALLVFSNFRRGLSQKCIEELKSLFGDKAPSYSTVENWFHGFNCRRRSLKDEVREGRQKTAVVAENIEDVRELIMLKRRL